MSVHALKWLFFLLGLCTSTQVLSYPFIAEHNPKHLTATATAVAAILVMGGGAVAQILFGALLQLHSSPLSTHYTAADFRFAIGIFPLSALVAIAMVLLMKESSYQHDKSSV
jgi:MFS family permease